MRSPGEWHLAQFSVARLITRQGDRRAMCFSGGRDEMRASPPEPLLNVRLLCGSASGAPGDMMGGVDHA